MHSMSYRLSWRFRAKVTMVSTSITTTGTAAYSVPYRLSWRFRAKVTMVTTSITTTGTAAYSVRSHA